MNLVDFLSMFPALSLKSSNSDFPLPVVDVLSRFPGLFFRVIK